VVNIVGRRATQVAVAAYLASLVATTTYSLFAADPTQRLLGGVASAAIGLMHAIDVAGRHERRSG
jgi:hypothetical protein